MNAPAVKFPHGISFEDFLATLNEDTHAEWVDGEVVPMSPGTEWQSQLILFVGGLLRTYARRKGLGEVYVPAYQMKTNARRSREPDVMFVAREHLDRVHETYLDGPADLVVEIISPASRTLDRGEKFHEYQEAGIREYWLIDPQRKQVESYRLGSAGVYERVPLGEPACLRSDLLPGLWIKVDWLWEKPLRDVLDVAPEWGLV
jgi:Uma2 family endonuclease